MGAPLAPVSDWRGVLRLIRVTLTAMPRLRLVISSAWPVRISAAARPTVPYPTMPTRTSRPFGSAFLGSAATLSVVCIDLLQSLDHCRSIGIQGDGSFL